MKVVRKKTVFWYFCCKYFPLEGVFPYFCKLSPRRLFFEMFGSFPLEGGSSGEVCLGIVLYSIDGT
jgi:hypothetical protein